LLGVPNPSSQNWVDLHSIHVSKLQAQGGVNVDAEGQMQASLRCSLLRSFVGRGLLARVGLDRPCRHRGAKLRHLVPRLPVDGLVLITWTHDPAAQCRSDELLAQEFALSANGAV
jgi:hypothetical protein